MLAFLSPLITALAKLFSSQAFFRVLLAISLFEVLYLMLNRSISFFIGIIVSYFGQVNLPQAVCYVFEKVGFFELMSFSISMYISVAIAKYFLRLSERLV